MVSLHRAEEKRLPPLFLRGWMRAVSPLGSPRGAEAEVLVPTQPSSSLGTSGLLAASPMRVLVKWKGEGAGWTTGAAPESGVSIGELAHSRHWLCLNDSGPRSC